MSVINNPERYRKGWRGGLPETPCGAGSTLANTYVQRIWLERWAREHGINDVGDIGAGDLNWVRAMEWSVTYQAYDLVQWNDQVRPLDIVREVPPRHDLLMCFWVLNHFPEDDARAAIDNMRASGCRYLAMTWDKTHWPFLDIEPVDQVRIRGPKHGAHDGVFVRLIQC